MTTAKEYLEILREREPQLWKEPLKESGFTEKDLSEIEEGLGYKLPVPYREFLLSYKMPNDITVSAFWRQGLSRSEMYMGIWSIWIWRAAVSLRYMKKAYMT